MGKELAHHAAIDSLTEFQQAFVHEYLNGGGVRADLAYMRAYPNCKSTNAAAVESCRMLRNPKILAALREEADRMLRAGVILGASVLVEIAGDPLHKDRLKAAESLMNRSGMIVETINRTIVEDRRENAEIVKSIQNLAEKLGVDPTKLLGQKGAQEAIDVEYEEVGNEDWL